MMMHSSSKTPVQIFFDYFHHPKLELVLSSFFAGNLFKELAVTEI